MNIVIVEDEMPAYRRLSKLTTEILGSAAQILHMDSIKSTKDYYSSGGQPDLLFLDIHLADGSGLDLLNMVDVHCPVIFTTAYDQYALEAFNVPSVGYLLKPIKKEDLRGALSKLDAYKRIFGPEKSGGSSPVSLPEPEYRKRFVIRFGEHIKTLAAEDIAYCYSENKATFAKTFEGRSLPMDFNLDSLEQMLDPQQFFRINRKYFINLASIMEMKTYSKGRVIVSLRPPVPDAPVVSSERAADFKLWLAGEWRRV